MASIVWEASVINTVKGALAPFSGKSGVVCCKGPSAFVTDGVMGALVKVPTPGDVLLPSNLLGVLADTDTDIAIEDKGTQLLIQAGAFSGKLRRAAADTLPSFPPLPGKAAWSNTPEDFWTAVRAVEFVAAAQETGLLQLAGVLVLDGFVFASDGRRGAKYPIVGVPQGFIPARLVKAVSAVCNDGVKSVAFTERLTWTRLASVPAVAFCTLPAEPYPEGLYTTVTAHMDKAGVDVEWGAETALALGTTLDRLKLFVGPGGVHLVTAKQTLLLQAQNELGEVRETLPVKVKRAVDVMLDWAYLRDSILRADSFGVSSSSEVDIEPPVVFRSNETGLTSAVVSLAK